MRTLVRLLVLSAIVIALVAAAPLAPSLRPADAEDRIAWRGELLVLERHLASAYANFEWSARERGLDLPALHRAADSAIAEAPSRHAARKALRRLVAAFDDGHLHLDAPKHPLAALLDRARQGDGSPIQPGATAGDACRRLGFSDDADDPGVRFDQVAGYRPMRAAPFRAGLVPSPRGGMIGVLRIPEFGERRYGRACEAVWDSVRAGAASPCGDECDESIRQAVSNRLLAALAETVRLLADSGAETLIADVTGNGGGSGLADAVARELTSVPLRGSAVGMVRHPHWSEALRRSDSLIGVDLADPELDDGQRALLQRARGTVAALGREIATPCDATLLWRGAALSCSPLVTEGNHSTGLLSYAGPGALDGLASAEVLFHPSWYRYREGAFGGRLVVLIDRGSASATEQFAALLRDNEAAVVLGEPSYGAGCGYTNGGIELELPRAGLVLRAPDCARLRKSGQNERAGIAPDIAVPWAGTNGADRAMAVLGALP